MVYFSWNSTCENSLSIGFILEAIREVRMRKFPPESTGTGSSRHREHLSSDPATCQLGLRIQTPPDAHLQLNFPEVSSLWSHGLVHAPEASICMSLMKVETGTDAEKTRGQNILECQRFSAGYVQMWMKF